MGIAAYNRGSAVIGNGIALDYKCSVSAKLHESERLQRIEHKIEELEKFCVSAQSLLVDISYDDSATGMLKRHMRQRWLSKRCTKRYRQLDAQHISAHVDWVNSDRRYSEVHLQLCFAKARVLLEKLNFLNISFQLPFQIPKHII